MRISPRREASLLTAGAETARKSGHGPRRDPGKIHTPRWNGRLSAQRSSGGACFLLDIRRAGTILNFVVKHKSPPAPPDATLSALADPARRAIVERLGAGEATVSELAAPFTMSMPAVSKHLRVLERAGLLAQERRGRTRVCRLNRAPLDNLARWLERYTTFWNDRLDALAEHFESNPEIPGAPAASAHTPPNSEEQR